MDTGKTVPESEATLLLQQEQLKSGKRAVQMFPKGTQELPLPRGFSRVENARGVFHYSSRVTEEQILELSSQERENELLLLGPYNKRDISDRVRNGEPLIVLSEYSPDGTEVRSAAGTPSTLLEQLQFFTATKEAANVLRLGVLPQRIQQVLGEQNA